MSYSKITGTGSYVPEKVLTNFDLEKMVDTSDEWITKRTGIKERYIIAEDQTVSDMAEIASRRAIEMAGIDVAKIDMIIAATFTGEYATPSVACVVQSRLGLKNCPAFDISVGCSGFIYGLDIADTYIKNGKAKTILFVAGEALSKITDWTDRSTCVLFGDGAGAVVIQADTKPGLRSSHIHADGSLYEMLYAPRHQYPFLGKPYVHMGGNELFKVAVKRLGEMVTKTLAENHITGDDIDWLVSHQANLRIINAVAKRISLSREKIILTIQKYGNTSASSIGLALDDGVRSGKIKPGDTVLMEAFGAGLTWGSVLLDF